MENLKVTLKGISPLLMHSDRLSNPLDPMTKRHKELTSKRKKTDEDHAEIAYSDWRNALYWDEKLGPYLPACNLESMMIEAAKMQKLGKKFKSAIFIMDDKIKLDYQGPRDIEGLFAGGFVDSRSVRVSQARTQRFRPVFNQWGCTFELLYNEGVIDAREIAKALDDAGKLVGLGDFRPRFGRFEVSVK